MGVQDPTPPGGGKPKGETKMKKTFEILAIAVLTAFAGSALAQAPATGTLKNDRAAVKADRQAIKADREKLKADRAAGNKDAVAADKARLKADHGKL